MRSTSSSSSASSAGSSMAAIAAFFAATAALRASSSASEPEAASSSSAYDDRRWLTLLCCLVGALAFSAELFTCSRRHASWAQPSATSNQDQETVFCSGTCSRCTSGTAVIMRTVCLEGLWNSAPALA